MLQQATTRFAARSEFARPVLDLGLVRQLTIVLLAAALLETALLRITVRVGVHVPKEAPLRSAFEAVSLGGSLAFNLASLLTIVLVALLLGLLVLRMEGRAEQLSLAALSLAMLWGLATCLATGDPTADAVFGLTISLLVGFVGLAFTGRETSRAGRLALALIVVAYLCFQYYSLAHLWYRMLDYAAAPPFGAAALQLGELLVVLASVAVFWAWGAPRWQRLGLGGGALAAAPVLAISLASFSPTSTMPILALWTTGLSLVLPLPVYLLALGLYLATIVACWRSGDGFWPASGLLLILLAGYMAESSYQHLLLLLGIAYLSGAVRRALPEPAASG